MLLATTDLKRDYETIGLVRGSEMKAVHLGKDITAGIRKLFGGDVKEYSDLLKEARDQALDEMEAEAEELGADAVIGVRFATSTITNGAAEIVAYGTAVKF
ncbi:MAG: YbjQ family protein [Halanaerobiaceae bacterium]